jgi:hypothetical protein
MHYPTDAMTERSYTSLFVSPSAHICAFSLSLKHLSS